MTVDMASCRVEAVRVAILAAATEGKTCPTNEELARLTGYGSPAGPAMAIERLLREGAMERRRAGRARQFRFPALGVATAALPHSGPSDDEWQPGAEHHEVRDAVARAFAVEPEDILGERGSHQVSNVRRAVVWALHREFADLSYHQIGVIVGGRDRTTIYHYLSGKEVFARDEALNARIDAALKGRPLPQPAASAPCRARIARRPLPEPDLIQLRPGRWCSQCDALVRSEAAEACGDKFCSLRRAA